MGAAIEIEDAGKVAGVAHVHGIGYGLHAGTGIILAGLQVVIENVIGIVGCDETLYRQPHPFAEEPSNIF